MNILPHTFTSHRVGNRLRDFRYCLPTSVAARRQSCPEKKAPMFHTLLSRIAILLLALTFPVCCAAAGLESNVCYLFQKEAIKLDAVRVLGQIPGVVSAELRDKNGVILRKGELPFADGELTSSLNWPGKGLLPGKYTLVFRTPDGASVLAEKAWDLPEPPKWLGTKAGTFDDDWIPEPWTSLVVASSQPLQVKCWNRQYTFGASGLFDSIQSCNADLLSSPMVWEASLGGKPVAWKPESVKVRLQRRGAIEFESCQRAEQLQLTCIGQIEFDGFVKLNFRLSNTGSPVSLDNLSVVIPLRSEIATLMHHHPKAPVWFESGNSILAKLNAGYVPPAGWRSVFLPHLWIGDEDKGLQWLCESAEDWRPSDEAKAIEVLPQGKNTVVRLNIIGKPTRLDKPREYTFAFQASPVKPMPTDRYKWHYTHAANLETPHSWIDSAKDSGVRTLGIHCWTDWLGYPLPSNENNAEKLRSMVAYCHQGGMKVLPYHALLASNKSPEYAAVFQECRIVDKSAFSCPGYMKDTVFTVCPRSIWADFEIDSIAKLIRDFNLDGVYSDSLTCVGDCSNQLHGCGYVGEDGKVHATVMIFAARDFAKRLRRVLDQQGKGKLLVGHTSASITLPALSFCDVYLDMEHLTGCPRPFRLSLDAFRAEFMGRNFGIPAQSLSYGWKGTGLTVLETLAISLLHDVEEPWAYDVMPPVWKAWDAFGVDKAEFLPYWKPWGWQAPDGVKVSAYSKPDGQMLIVAVNLSDKEVRGLLRVKSPIKSVTDALNGAAGKVTDGAIEDSFPVWQAKMYRVQLGP